MTSRLFNTHNLKIWYIDLLDKLMMNCKRRVSTCQKVGCRHWYDVLKRLFIWYSCFKWSLCGTSLPSKTKHTKQFNHSKKENKKRGGGNKVVIYAISLTLTKCSDFFLNFKIFIYDNITKRCFFYYFHFFQYHSDEKNDFRLQQLTSIARRRCVISENIR